MADRRRTIALTQDGPLGNAGNPTTGIPLPGSTMKKPALRAPAARISMAPGAGAARGSIMPGAGMGMGMGMGMGNSMGGGGQDAALRRSTILSGPGGRGVGVGYGVTPQSNKMLGGAGSVRRQSNYPSVGRPSILPSQNSQPTRDPRPIRSQAFQQSCRERLDTFCREQRCPLQITDRTFISPTQRQFFDIFRWLISTFLDPAYAWTVPKSSKNADSAMGDDIFAILRDFKYPGIEGISKTALAAPGNEKTWPVLLAMLSWLVDLCKAQEMWADPEVVSDPLLMPASALPIDHPQLEDRLGWDFISGMYTQWFRGEGDEFPEAHMELADAYDRIQQQSVEEGDRIELLLQKRTVELQQLQAQEPPLKTLEDEYLRLMSDKTKFIAFIELHRQKAEKIKQGVTKARSIIADHESQIDTARGELANIESAVLAQNLSPDEVQRMNHERDTLGRQLDELRQKTAEASQYSYDQELAVTRSMDRFEQLVSDYTALGHSIGTIPPVTEGPAGMGPGDVDFTVDLDLGVEDMGEVQVAGQRLRGTIWPALIRYGDGFRRELEEVENGNIQLDDEVDRLGQKVERQKEEAANLEIKLRVVQDQAEEAKARLQSDTTETNRKISKLEHEVAQITMSTQRGVQDLQSQMETTRIEYNELRHKTAALHEAIQKELITHVEVIVRAKQHTTSQLKSIRAVAEST